MREWDFTNLWLVYMFSIWIEIGLNEFQMLYEYLIAVTITNSSAIQAVQKQRQANSSSIGIPV